MNSGTSPRTWDRSPFPVSGGAINVECVWITLWHTNAGSEQTVEPLGCIMCPLVDTSIVPPSGGIVVLRPWQTGRSRFGCSRCLWSELTTRSFRVLGKGQVNSWCRSPIEVGTERLELGRRVIEHRRARPPVPLNGMLRLQGASTSTTRRSRSPPDQRSTGSSPYRMPAVRAVPMSGPIRWVDDSRA